MRHLTFNPAVVNLKVFRFTHRTAPVQQGPLCCFEVKSEQEGGAERCQGKRMPKARFKTNQLNIVINFSLACTYLLSRKQGCRNGEGTPNPRPGAT